MGGSGLIAPGGTAKITVSSGAKISPGGDVSGGTINKLVINGANTSATGLLTLSGGAGLEFGLDGTAVTGDQIQLINGAVGDIVFTNNIITLSLTGILSSGQTYTLFDGTANNQYTGLNFISHLGSIVAELFRPTCARQFSAALPAPWRG